MRLPQVHHLQGKSLPTILHKLIHVMAVFLAIPLPLKEDSRANSINNTRRVVILVSRPTQDIQGSLLREYQHLRLHHIFTEYFIAEVISIVVSL